MANWDRVKWTEAGQVGEMLGWPVALDGHGREPPQTYFAKLRQDGRLQDAAYFLGQALPRYETVVWAARVVQHLAGSSTAEADARALGATQRWVDDPSDPNRRAAFAAASGPAESTAAGLTALAAFFSGGSMSVEGQPAVPPPRDAAGRFAAGAVIVAAVRSGDQATALNTALDIGDMIAAQGL